MAVVTARDINYDKIIKVTGRESIRNKILKAGAL